MLENSFTMPIYSAPVARKPWHNNNLFIVMKINGRISKCTRCQGNFQKMPNKNPCPPPLDLVILHVEKEEYPYKNPDTMVVETRVSSEKRKYYHPNPSCILKRHPHFKNSMLGFSWFHRCASSAYHADVSAPCLNRTFYRMLKLTYCFCKLE